MAGQFITSCSKYLLQSAELFRTEVPSNLIIDLVGLIFRYFLLQFELLLKSYKNVRNKQQRRNYQRCNRYRDHYEGYS